MTLEVAMLAERKDAKIIELLEQLRRDHPNIADRVDEDATAMSQPTNAKAVVKAINSCPCRKSDPDVTMVQSAEDRQRENATYRLDRPR